MSKPKENTECNVLSEKLLGMQTNMVLHQTKINLKQLVHMPKINLKKENKKHLMLFKKAFFRKLNILVDLFGHLMFL